MEKRGGLTAKSIPSDNKRRRIEKEKNPFFFFSLFDLSFLLFFPVWKILIRCDTFPLRTRDDWTVTCAHPLIFFFLTWPQVVAISFFLDRFGTHQMKEEGKIGAHRFRHIVATPVQKGQPKQSNHFGFENLILLFLLLTGQKQPSLVFLRIYNMQPNRTLVLLWCGGRPQLKQTCKLHTARLAVSPPHFAASAKRLQPSFRWILLVV